MNPRFDNLTLQTRRHFLQQSQLGLGSIALAAMLGNSASAATPDATADAVINPLAPKSAPLPAKAKRVIYLHLTGSPPHLDLYDYKPELVKHNDEPCPDSFLKGKRFAFTTGVPKLMGTPRKFTQNGQGGVWLSDAIPNLHGVADDRHQAGGGLAGHGDAADVLKVECGARARGEVDRAAHVEHDRAAGGGHVLG